MKRKIISLEEASTILEPYYDNLVSCIGGGVNDYFKIKEFVDSFGRFTKHENRTKGSIIHDQIKARISETFGEDSLFESNGVFGLKINNDFLIRFKKLDDYKKVAGYKTNQYIKYMGQSIIDGFPDTPTFLFAGYIPDKSWTSIKGIYIACWNGSTIEWFDEIGKYAVQQLNIFQQPATEEEQNRMRVRLKRNKNDINKNKTGTNG